MYKGIVKTITFGVDVNGGHPFLMIRCACTVEDRACTVEDLPCTVEDSCFTVEVVLFTVEVHPFTVEDAQSTVPQVTLKEEIPLYNHDFLICRDNNE